MIPLPFLHNQTIGVLGLGKTGQAVIRALVASGARVVAWDDKEAARPQGEGYAVLPPAEWPWTEMALLVLSPGLPYTHPAPHAGVVLAQRHRVDIVGDIELLYRARPNALTLAITGTNGKSTTTSLIGHILAQAGRKVAVGGNLGTPALALDPEADAYVLELSSYQLDLVRTTRFNIAVLLNFSPDHLDRHGDMAGYIAAKKHIFDRQQSGDVAIIGVDDPYAEALCREMIAAAKQRIVPIMTTQRSERGVWVKDGVLHEGSGFWVLGTDTQTRTQKPEPRTLDLTPMLTLQGTHNHQNAAAAYAACRAAGVTPEQIGQGMRSYPGLAHRMQRVAEIDGLLFVNDSKATNADAAAKSLGTYDRIYWIAGGVAKAGGIDSLAPFFPRIARAFLIGEAQEAFARTLDGHVDYECSGTLEQAVASAHRAARAEGQGGVILLAPACASFDQFTSFEHRGQRFAELVQQLPI